MSSLGPLLPHHRIWRRWVRIGGGVVTEIGGRLTGEMRDGHWIQVASPARWESGGGGGRWPGRLREAGRRCRRGAETERELTCVV
jgi:hypothetical protein